MAVQVEPDGHSPSDIVQSPSLGVKKSPIPHMPTFHSCPPQVSWLAPAPAGCFICLTLPGHPLLQFFYWGLGRVPSHSPLLNCQLTPGGSRWPPAPILVLRLKWDPQWPLYLLWIPNSSGKGGTWSRGHSSPLAAPGGTSLLIPWICLYANPCFGNGLMLLTVSGQGGGLATLSFLLRWLPWPGPSGGPPSPWQDSFLQRHPSSPS